MKFGVRRYEYKVQLEIFTEVNKLSEHHLGGEKYYLLHSLVERIISLVQIITIIFGSNFCF